MFDYTLNEDGTCTLLHHSIEIGKVQNESYARSIVFAVNKTTQEHREEIAIVLGNHHPHH